jgi:hypothetical protein
MAKGIGWRGLLKSIRLSFFLGDGYAVVGIAWILRTAVGHASGGYAVIGALWLVMAALWLAATFERRRRERSGSIK